MRRGVIASAFSPIPLEDSTHLLLLNKRRRGDPSYWRRGRPSLWLHASIGSFDAYHTPFEVRERGDAGDVQAPAASLTFLFRPVGGVDIWKYLSMSGKPSPVMWGKAETY